MFPWKKELKIQVCFSCFLTLAVLPHGGSFLWWEQRGNGRIKVLIVKVSHNLPFPTNKGCLWLCYMACPERHWNTRTWLLWGLRQDCCGTLDLLISWKPSMDTCAELLHSQWPLDACQSKTLSLNAVIHDKHQSRTTFSASTAPSDDR